MPFSSGLEKGRSGEGEKVNEEGGSKYQRLLRERGLACLSGSDGKKIQTWGKHAEERARTRGSLRAWGKPDRKKRERSICGGG